MIALRYWRTTRHRRTRGADRRARDRRGRSSSAIARVALQEHFPTDLLGGLFGGIAALSLYAWFTRPGGWADRPPLANEDGMSDGAGEPVGGEGGPLGADTGGEPVEVRSRTPARRHSARELGLATATVVVGFAGLTACLVVFGSVAEGVRSQEVFALDTWATPFLHGISSPGMDAAMNVITDLGTIYVIVPALVLFAAWLLRTGHVRSVVVPRRRDARQPRPARRDEAVLRPSPARARVVTGPARLQLPERAHAERGGLLRRGRPRRLVGVRPSGGHRRARDRRRRRARGRRQPHLPRLPLPDGRGGRDARRDRLAAWSSARRSGLVRRGAAGDRGSGKVRRPAGPGTMAAR